MVNFPTNGKQLQRNISKECIIKTLLAVSGCLLLFESLRWNHEGAVRSLDAIGVLEALETSQTAGVGGVMMVRGGSPLDIPQGEAQAQPSIRVEAADEDVERGIYGGKGDKKHLGGFTAYDKDGVSPAVWKHMLSTWGIKSLMDVGCGKGVSTLWFYLHGVEVLCVEGSHDAVQRTLLPNPALQVVEHDYSRGPYWPADTYDAVWSVEFLEHVGRNFQYNYMQTFRKAALIFVSYSQWGGWHHVEVHDKEWWITKFESYGFKHSKAMTDKVQGLATEERGSGAVGPDGVELNAQHIWLNMQVFINPMVASLPKHAHLFAEHGCFKGRENGEWVNKECGTLRGGETESKLPDSFYPLKLTPEQDDAWMQRVKESIDAANAEANAATA